MDGRSIEQREEKGREGGSRRGERGGEAGRGNEGEKEEGVPKHVIAT